MAEEPKRFTLAELSQYNGQDGKPAYIAYDGKVFDVTSSRLWRNGGHMRLHRAGEDLTADLAEAPHDTNVLDRFPQVGVLAPQPRPAPVPIDRSIEIPAFLEALFERFPRLRRHPHPMTVHFPIVFMMFAPLFLLGFLASGLGSLELASVYCLSLGLLFTLVAVPTGFLTWWVNYLARPIRAVTIKIVTSTVMFLLGLFVFVWRLVDPRIAYRGDALYFVLFLLLFPAPFVLGVLGASLTFPVRKDKRSRRQDPG